MKTIRLFVILMTIASFSALPTAGANEWESYELVNQLLNIQKAGSPVIYENHVIFTADSSLRRVGVAFAHEDFSNIYWFRQLVIPQERINPIILPGEKEPRPFRDSGMQFHVYQLPANLRELEYRLIINGLWTTDPINLQSRRDPVSGLMLSVLNLPYRPIRPSPLNGLPEGLEFTYRGPPGETITVAGCFNSWDPFMYELREISSGNYKLTLPLPTGTYQYVFFHQGQRFTDPHNPNRAYSRDGSAASQIVVP